MLLLRDTSTERLLEERTDTELRSEIPGTLNDLSSDRIERFVSEENERLSDGLDEDDRLRVRETDARLDNEWLGVERPAVIDRPALERLREARLDSERLGRERLCKGRLDTDLLALTADLEGLLTDTFFAAEALFARL